MTGTITIRNNLQMLNGNFNYNSAPSTFAAIQTNVGGPTPGTVLASHLATGTLVNLTALTTPGFAFIQNLDLINFVTLGLIPGVGTGSLFYPILELGPGEFVILKLSRTLLVAGVLALLADTADCKVRFDAMEK